MKFFDFADYEPRVTADRTDYHRRYYQKHRKRSVRKKPVMTEAERHEAKKAADKRYRLSIKNRANN